MWPPVKNRNNHFSHCRPLRDLQEKIQLRSWRCSLGCWSMLTPVSWPTALGYVIEYPLRENLAEGVPTDSGLFLCPGIWQLGEYGKIIVSALRITQVHCELYDVSHWPAGRRHHTEGKQFVYKGGHTETNTKNIIQTIMLPLPASTLPAVFEGCLLPDASYRMH